MRVIVAGGGIGGLSTAIALAQQGCDVVVVEKSNYEETGGAGIQISPNASRVLEEFNLGRALARVATEPRAIEVRAHRSGLKVAELALGAAARARYGAAYYCLCRSELITVLREAVSTDNRIELVTGTALGVPQSDDSRVRVAGSAAGDWCGDLLVGADGIHSTALRYVDVSARPRFTGMAAWRALIRAAGLPKHLVRDIVTLWPGPGAHLVHYPVSGGRFVNLIGCVERSDWQDSSWTATGALADLKRDFRGWNASIQTLLDAVDTPYLWALFDRPTPARWTRQRVTLLGDACHPMLPFAAQGAAQAIEDAWVLADSLAATRDVDAALARYQQRRAPRVQRVQLESSRRAALYHQRSALRRIAALAPILSPAGYASGWATDSLDWLYGCDVVDRA